MASTAPATAPSLAERADIHKSCKSLELIVNVFNDYCQAATTLAALQRKLAKALREAASLKCSGGPVSVNALGSTATVFETLADVDARFAKTSDRECEDISSEVKKWFKRLAKEEKSHDERIANANTKIKNAGMAYEKVAAKKKADPSLEHARYIQLLSSLGPDMAQDKYNHALSTTQGHTAVVLSVSACLARVADAEWTRGCETVRRSAPVIGDVIRWRAFCEGGWTQDPPAEPEAQTVEERSETIKANLFGTRSSETSSSAASSDMRARLLADEVGRRHLESVDESWPNSVRSALPVRPPPGASATSSASLPAYELTQSEPPESSVLSHEGASSRAPTPERSSIAERKEVVQSVTEVDNRQAAPVAPPAPSQAIVQPPEAFDTLSSFPAPPTHGSEILQKRRSPLPSPAGSPCARTNRVAKPEQSDNVLGGIVTAEPESQSRTGSPQQQLPMRASNEVPSSPVRASSVVAAMRDRYGQRMAPINPPSSPPPRDLPRPRGSSSVSQLANRFSADVNQYNEFGSRQLPQPNEPLARTSALPTSPEEPPADEIAMRRQRIQELEDLERREMEYEARIRNRDRTQNQANSSYFSSNHNATKAYPHSKVYAASSTHLAAPRSSVEFPSRDRHASSQPPSPVAQPDHAPYCMCEDCSQRHYTNSSLLSPSPRPLAQQKPKGWIRRLSMPVQAALSLDSKVGSKTQLGLPPPDEHGFAVRRSFERDATGGISSATNRHSVAVGRR